MSKGAITLVLLLAVSGQVRGQNLLSGPNDIVFDGPHDRYLVSCWAGNRIVAVDLQGQQSLFKDNVTRAHGMQIRDSLLYVASARNLLIINLSTGAVVKSIVVPGSQYLGHLTMDDSRNVYITDWSARAIFTVDILADTATLLLATTDIPVGIWFDGQNSRLILLSFMQNAPVRAVSLPGAVLSTITTTAITNTDAICRDAAGHYYVSSLTENRLYCFNADWSGSPTIVSTGLGGPSGLGYNARDNVLGVTNYDSGSITLIPLGSAEVRESAGGTPTGSFLEQNYPNPFNGATMIKYQVPSTNLGFGAWDLGFVSLKVYDMLGREVTTLVDEVKEAGYYSVQWNASGIVSGVYFYRMSAGKFTDLKKLMMVK